MGFFDSGELTREVKSVILQSHNFVTKRGEDRMQCISCGRGMKPSDGTQGPICDVCRDANPHTADRARMIEAAGEPLEGELEQLWDRVAIERMPENDTRW